jgi:hypothetical protein
VTPRDISIHALDFSAEEITVAAGAFQARQIVGIAGKSARARDQRVVSLHSPALLAIWTERDGM